MLNSGFPATLWVTGTRSFGMSPVIARLLKPGIDSHLYVMEGGRHGAFHIGHHMTPEGQDIILYVARWFRRHLAR
jgi:hypothetical protein